MGTCPKGKTGWMLWQKARWRGDENVPDYYIDETGPAPVFYCVCGHESIEEHQAKWQSQPAPSLPQQ